MVAMKQETPRYVHPASYGKTTLAFLLDSAFTIAMIFILYFAFGKTVVLPAQGYDATYEEYTSFIKDCSLTQGDESGTLLTYDETIVDGVPGWQRYRDAVITYYTVFIPSDNGAEFYETDGVEKGNDGRYLESSIEKFVLANVYKLNLDGSQISEGGDPYFVLDGSTEDPYDVTLADGYKDLKASDNLKLGSLKTYFANSDDQTGPYYEAVKHLSSQPRFLELQSEVGLKRYVSFLPSFILSPLIFFLIIPLCVPDGRSLGKLIVKTAIIGANGYKAKKLNIAIHCAILALIWECLLIPSTMVGIMIIALVFLIDYLSLILSKNHTSIHDKIARTLVINAKESNWFKDADEEEQFIKDNPDSSVAGFYVEENGHLPGEEAAPVVETPHGLSEDTILDLSTIGKARREAATITSFDEFEKRQSVTSISPVEIKTEETENPAKAEDKPENDGENGMKD